MAKQPPGAGAILQMATNLNLMFLRAKDTIILQIDLLLLRAGREDGKKAFPTSEAQTGPGK